MQQKSKYRLPAHWSFVSCEQNVNIHAIRVNNSNTKRIILVAMLFFIGRDKNFLFKQRKLIHLTSCFGLNTNICAFLRLIELTHLLPMHPFSITRAGTSDLSKTYVHSKFTMFLIKTNFWKKINHRGQHPKAGRSFGLELTLVLNIWTLWS